MLAGHITWEWALVALKLLKTFGIIPGAIAAYSVQKMLQRRRQKHAIEGWPATEATIQSGTVHKEGLRRYWAEVTYSYYVGEYRSGSYLRLFRREADADEFIRQLKDKRVRVHYNGSDAEKSVILDRDVEMIAMLAPQFG